MTDLRLGEAKKRMQAEQAGIYKAMIPTGHCDARPVDGCIILEGGAWRGLYTQGALDVLMEEGILFQTTIGISAGAMSGISYLAGAIGKSARWNLGHRLDDEYFGKNAFRAEKGITGFRYFLEKSEEEEPIDRAAFWNTEREFIAGATNCLTGREHYFYKNRYVPAIYAGSPGRASCCEAKRTDGGASTSSGQWRRGSRPAASAGQRRSESGASVSSGQCRRERPDVWSEENPFLKAIAASASVPYISMPVKINGVPYLDGSCAVNIPIHLAQRMGFRKIMVLKTQDRSFRAAVGRKNRAAEIEYARIYPGLQRALETNHGRYNRTLDEIDALEKKGEIFVLAPSRPIEHGNLQKNLRKLSEYYWMGYADMKAAMPALKAYLAE